MQEPIDRWDDSGAARLDVPNSLVYRSRLLGADLAITNFGGGNTSAKLVQPDPLTGAPTEVLWVKGSGGDLGSIGLDGFATVDLARLRALEARYRGRAHEDELVPLLAHCTFNLNPRAASIDTPLHGLLPFAHIDHVHPDAVIAIAAARDSERLTAEAFGGEVGWLPWQRPGFDLGLRLRDYVLSNPGLSGVVLAGHGLIAWGDTSAACYRNTVALVARAARFIGERDRGVPFGARAAAARPHPAEERRRIAALLAFELRALVSESRHKVAHFSDAEPVLDFVCSERLAELAALGTSCPDHFLRTKVRPLVADLDWSSAEWPAELARLVATYREDYAAYYERHRRADSPALRDRNPVICLVPRVGLLAFAADKSTARIAAEFYGNAIAVMRGATAIDDYVGLDEGEAFQIEYWALEEAKLKRLPPPKPLSGRVAYVTGAASGIGRAVAQRLAAAGACVMLTDINRDALAAAESALAAQFGRDVVRAEVVDVTSERAVGASVERTVLEYGGIDIVVASAGIASSASIEETTLALWQRNFDILSTGYFLVARATFARMKRQGGAMVFVASKNALVASVNAAAYCSAKAAEVHLARCLALEGAPFGIRVNTVNPDAVLQGSSIWSGDWREARAAAYGVEPAALDRFYAERSLLKRPVLPEDVAEAVYFLASDAAAKSTGNVINVDAGHAAAFVR